MHVPVAALYRVSDRKQVKRNQEEDDSIDTQKEVIRKYVVERPEWRLVKEYEEPGVSAYKLSMYDRDILDSAIADALNGVFRILLVFKYDRLSRNSVEYPLILWQLHRAGVKVIAVADTPGGRELKMEDQTDKLLRFMEGWQGETESKNNSIRVSERMKSLAEKGHWNGGRPPYGFRLSPLKTGLPLVRDEQEAEVLLEIARLIEEEDAGGKVIANILNEKGWRTREGRLWSESRVRDVIQNPIVAGLPAYLRTRPGHTANSRIRIQGIYNLDNFIVPRDENGDPKPIPEYVIIPLERWQRIMRIIAERNTRRGRETISRPKSSAMLSSSLLTGFLVCGYCGRGFISSKCNNKKVKSGNRVYTYEKRDYRCITHARIGNGRAYCGGQSSYSQKKVDGIFLGELENFLSNIDPRGLERFLEEKQFIHLAESSKRIKAIEAELRKSRKVYKAWVQRLDAYFADPGASLYSEDLLAFKVKEYELLCAKLEDELRRVKEKSRVQKWQREHLREFSRRAPEWYKIFSESPVPVRKKMLASIIDKVVLYRDRMEIHYKVDLNDFLAERKPAVKEKIELQLRVSASF
ncbi:MAG: recombinase family protein [Desulfotomaculales bacterium]